MIGRAAALVGVGLLSGCAAVCGDDARGSVQIVAGPDANGFSAIAVDVVAVRTEGLADKMAALSAQDYFLTKAQIVRDNPVGLGISGWEIAPGQTVGPVPVGFPCGVDGVFVFASYQSAGEHRVRLRDLDDVLITLGPTSFDVTKR